MERNPNHLPAGSSKGGEFTSGQLSAIEESARKAAGLSSSTIKKVVVNNVKFELEIDKEFEKTSALLPNGKKAQKYKVYSEGTYLGDIQETTAYKDTKKAGERIVSSRKNVVGYSIKTSNDNYPLWERNSHTTNRQMAFEWLMLRKGK